jgi:hypothetical protein
LERSNPLLPLAVPQVESPEALDAVAQKEVEYACIGWIGMVTVDC